MIAPLKKLKPAWPCMKKFFFFQPKKLHIASPEKKLWLFVVSVYQNCCKKKTQLEFNK